MNVAKAHLLSSPSGQDMAQVAAATNAFERPASPVGSRWNGAPLIARSNPVLLVPSRLPNTARPTPCGRPRRVSRRISNCDDSAVLPSQYDITSVRVQCPCQNPSGSYGESFPGNDALSMGSKRSGCDASFEGGGREPSIQHQSPFVRVTKRPPEASALPRRQQGPVRASVLKCLEDSPVLACAHRLAGRESWAETLG